ncbi:DUF5979 domain-containing protein [Agromyces mediolanus]|uniref:DUF5979 domain-containing protein n=1 Tax=Agromyces mediolanus TaxID=41986 RepID=A0A918FBW5_AGRME|nr:DUF5979 domain-containing protein [Agromyces mediolanus]GGR28977.1 hypothetical protein GCM10010196_23560 [Agromyces mediolanus]GLJ72152.1 hypothetical protein GCM10017583_14080 [Agromyces mediolanus]
MRSTAPRSHRPHPSLVRRLLAFVASIGLALVAVVVLPSAAHAAPNPAIVVGDVTIAPADTQATIGDSLTVSGSWNASEADPKVGDSFTIGLPPQLKFPQNVPFQLTGTTPSGDPVVWGNCLTDTASGIATCELTDEVEAFPELVMGTWQFQVEAVQATTAEAIQFDLNGKPVMVDLPGTGGIDDGIVLPGEVTKSGVMNQNNWSMTWTIDIPGANLVAAGGDTARITDTLGAGHALCDPTGLKVQTVRGSTVVDVTSIATLDGAPGDTSFGLALAGPFDANVTYRVTYQTCTEDGRIDPAGTEYENSAQIEGWGEAGHGVGTVANLPWHLNLGKSGSVLGGAERNGKVAWTVVVPGDQLLGKDGFTLTETLGAGHQLCTDTISGIQIAERYGPSNQLQQSLTGKLTPTTLASSPQSFQVRFDLNDSAVAFKASDYRYVITYTTCVTATELPNGGTAYANSVDVDGAVATNEATVPNRSQGKTGRINTTAVTIDGVQHMPQTTIGWSVTIPGQLIENVDGVLTLTDVLSDSQAVCAAGDPSAGLAARLGLRVEARDQIQNGGLQTVDLSGSTAVQQSGNTLTFDLDAVDLPIPTGTSDGFSREYQYVLTYTTCTATGGMDAPGTVYSNTLTGDGVSFSSTTTQNNSGSGTGQGVTRGSVSLVKTLVDNAGAAFVPADTMFTVHVKEIDPTATVQKEYELRVPLDGAPISGLNARGTGWTVELTEPTFPTVPGVTFGDPVFAEGPGVTVSPDGKTAIASIDPGVNVAVSLTNEALLGSATIVKELGGGAAELVDADRRYQVTAAIDTSALGQGFPAQADRVLQLETGVPVTLAELPIGATVHFTELRPVDDDTLTWAAPVITPSTVTVSAGHATTPAAITVTNSAERTVGTFAVAKTVTGAQADNPAVPDTVTVTASWTEEGVPGSTTLTVPTDGTPVPLGADLLIGTRVTLSETPLVDGSSIAWGAPSWSGPGVTVDGDSAVVTIGRTADATVALENHAATSTAGISLLKAVAGEAAGEVDPEAEFPVTARWVDADDVEHARELMISTAEPTPLGVELPAGTVVTITEGAQPRFDTVVWGSITISGAGVDDHGDGSATVVVSDQQDDVALVTVVNEATWAPGDFSIAKRVDGVRGDHPDVPAAVTVLAEWTDGDAAQSLELEVPTDGTVVAFPAQLPHGTEVTLSETGLEAGAQFTWATPDWTGDRVVASGDGTAVVTIGAADTAEVALVNTAVPTLGSVTITKTLAGEGRDAAAKTSFPVTITWSDLLGEPQSREVQLTAGTPATIDGLPLGTELRVEEGTAKLPEGIRWAGADWSSDDDRVTVTSDAGSAVATVTVTGESAAAAELSLENRLELGPALAGTGVDGVALGIVGGAALLAMLGGAAVLIARRRARG